MLLYPIRSGPAPGASILKRTDYVILSLPSVTSCLEISLITATTYSPNSSNGEYQMYYLSHNGTCSMEFEEVYTAAARVQYALPYAEVELDDRPIPFFFTNGISGISRKNRLFVDLIRKENPSFLVFFCFVVLHCKLSQGHLSDRREC